MFHIQRLFLVLTIALFLAACNDDDSSPSAPNPNDEIHSSDSNTSNGNSSGSNTSDNPSSSAAKDSLVVSYGTMTDARDGRTYKTITLGDSTWMAENLKFDYKVNGASFGSQCSDNDETNCERQGRLYSWAAAMDSAGVFGNDGLGCGDNIACYPYKRVHGICPEGWHLPNGVHFTRDEASTFLATTDSIHTYLSFEGIITKLHYALFWLGKEGSYENGYAAYATTDSFIKIFYARKNFDRLPIRCIKDYEENFPNILDVSIPKESHFNPNIDYGTMTDARGAMQTRKNSATSWDATTTPRQSLAKISTLCRNVQKNGPTASLTPKTKPRTKVFARTDGIYLTRPNGKRFLMKSAKKRTWHSN